MSSQSTEYRSGTCGGPLELGLLDVSGSRVAAPRDVVASVALLAGAGRLYEDSSCATAPVEQVTLPRGASSVRLYVETAAAGDVVVAAESAEALGTHGVLRFGAGPGTGLSWSAPAGWTAGECQRTDLSLVDRHGHPARASEALSVALSSEGFADLRFYVDADCQDEASSVRFAETTGQVAVYARATRVGAGRLRAALDAFTTSTEVTVSAGALSGLRFETPLEPLLVLECTPLVIGGEDAYGNAVPLADSDAVDLFWEEDAFRVYAQSDCTGSAEDELYPTDGVVRGSMRQGSDVPIVDLSARLGAMVAERRFEVVGQVDFLACVIQSDDMLSGGVGQCENGGTVRLRKSTSEACDGDAFEPIADTPLFLTASDPSVIFYADDSCTQTATAVVVSGASAPSFSVASFQAGRFELFVTHQKYRAAQLSFEVRPGAAEMLSLLAPEVSPGACAGPFVLESRDAFGNAVAVDGPESLTLRGRAQDGLAFFADADCETPLAPSLSAGAESLSFYLRTEVAGPQPLAVESQSLGTITAVLDVPAGPAVAPVFASPPVWGDAGACLGPVRLGAVDAFGNAVYAPAAPVEVFLEGDVSYFADADCGTAIPKATLSADTPAPEVYIQGSDAGDLVLRARIEEQSQAQTALILDGDGA